MARVRIILEDDDGKTISSERVYELGRGLKRLREIEAAVEEFKRSALPDLEEELLAEAQQHEVAEQKKAGG